MQDIDSYTKKNVNKRDFEVFTLNVTVLKDFVHETMEIFV